MGHVRTGLLVALAACGSNGSKTTDAPITIRDASPDAKVFLDAPPPDQAPDAPAFDFSCLGQPLPTMATATVTITGTAREVALMGSTPTITPKQGASIDACKAGAANCTGANKYGATSTTDSLGAFSIGPVTTGGNPVAAFLRMTATGDRTIQMFPPYPVVKDISNVPAVTFNNGLIALLPAVGITQSPSNGMIGLFVTDCQNMPLTGATVSAQEGGNDVGQIVDGSQFSAMAAGTFFVFDVPPGNVTVTATFNGMTFRTSPAQVVPSIAGTTTETQVRPGP